MVDRHRNISATGRTAQVHLNGETTTKLVPTPVLPFAPARHDERIHYLNLLYNQYKQARDKSTDSTLTDNDLRVKTVQTEYQLAMSNKNKMQYQHALKMLMFNLKKKGIEGAVGDTAKLQTGTTSKTTAHTVASPIGNDPAKKLAANSTDDVDNFDNVLRELNELCIPIQRLKRHEYVTEIPTLPSPDYTSPTTVKCSRCGIDFRIEDIKKPVKCVFHPGKRLTSTYQNFNMGRKVYGTDYTNRTYLCCKEPIGQSQGCKSLQHHVYKLEKPTDLHLNKPFQKIDNLRSALNIDSNSKIQQLRKSKISAVALDCEMCYTNRGFELMKLSVIDFKTEKKLMDNIIHPDGDLIIDLNSHVSGVDEIPKDSLTFDEALIKLAHMTDENTIVIGHGLENDLNVLRLIYPRIVDTAILFSENQINPRRKDPLKKLAWNFLSENIQGKQHDSLEDAIVPARIVKKHIEKVLNRKKLNSMMRR
jgi:RNA exonuclease 1